MDADAGAELILEVCGEVRCDAATGLCISSQSGNTFFNPLIHNRTHQLKERGKMLRLERLKPQTGKHSRSFHGRSAARSLDAASRLRPNSLLSHSLGTLETLPSVPVTHS